MNDLARLFDRLSQQMLGFDTFRTHFETVAPTFPPVNLYREGVDPNTLQPTGDYVLELAVSGYTSEDINIQVENINGINYLTIEGKAGRNLANSESIAWYNRGIANRSFKRSFSVFENVKVGEARLENGLLQIRFSIEEPVKNVKKIPILTQSSQNLLSNDKVLDNNTLAFQAASKVVK